MWQETSCCLGLHPLVCSLIAESHPLHELVGCVRTPTEDTTEKKRRATEMKKANMLFFPLLLSSNSNMLPSIYVRNRVLLLCLYLVQEGGENPPGLSQFIAGNGRRSISVPKIGHGIRNMVQLENVSVHITTNLRTKCIWFPQKTSRMSLS